MKIQDIISRKHILIDFKAADKQDLLMQMARFLVSVYNLDNADLVVRKILEREADMSTGVGFGIALPHCRIDGIASECMVTARCADEIDYNAIDDRPIRLVFMIVAPANTATQYTRMLSSLSKIMSREETRNRLLLAPDAESFLAIIVEGENALG